MKTEANSQGQQLGPWLYEVAQVASGCAVAPPPPRIPTRARVLAPTTAGHGSRVRAWRLPWTRGSAEAD